MSNVDANTFQCTIIDNLPFDRTKSDSCHTFLIGSLVKVEISAVDLSNFFSPNFQKTYITEV